MNILTWLPIYVIFFTMIGVQNEKRRMPRIMLTEPLRYQIRGEPEFSNTVCDNVSCGGISFINNKFIAPKKLVMLELKILSRTLYPIGRVAWTATLPLSDKYKIGIEFLEISREEKTYLSDYLDLKIKRY